MQRSYHREKDKTNVLHVSHDFAFNDIERSLMQVLVNYEKILAAPTPIESNFDRKICKACNTISSTLRAPVDSTLNVKFSKFGRTSIRPGLPRESA